MSIERQLRREAALCLSLLQRYQDAGRSAPARARMAAEVEVIIGWLMELDLSPGAARLGILKPVEDHLISRYGQEEGRRLNRDFVEAFGTAGAPLLFKDRYLHLHVQPRP